MQGVVQLATRDPKQGFGAPRQKGVVSNLILLLYLQPALCSQRETVSCG
jgi:hypothetical protein